MRFRLSDNHVAERGKRSAYPTVGRLSKQRKIWNTDFTQPSQCSGGVHRLPQGNRSPPPARPPRASPPPQLHRRCDRPFYRPASHLPPAPTPSFSPEIEPHL